MLTLYLVCLVVGGALVALSIFGGGDADVEMEVDAEFDSASTAADASEIAGGVPRARALSFRNIVFFVAFFGLTGTLFTVLDIGSWLTPPFAVGAGLAAAASLHFLMLRLADDDAGSVAGPEGLQGVMAEVTVEIRDPGYGKIAVRGGDRTLQLAARVADSAEIRQFHVGDEVVIVRVDDGIARVAGTQFLTL